MTTTFPISRPQTKQVPVPVADKTQDGTVEFTRKARYSGVGQPANLSSTLDVQRIQNALRTAERGDFWMLATIFRDMTAGYTHLQAEWAKRKLVITGQPEALIPASQDADDIQACEVIKEAISHCRNWRTGLVHLLDATLWPVSAAEKIYGEINEVNKVQFKYLKRYFLKEISPINYELLNFKVPYSPNGGTGSQNEALNFNPDDWEAWLRFYSTTPAGGVNYSGIGTYKPDPSIHIVHRGNMLSPTIPPNFGGHMRAILFWWLLATQDRDWWAQMMQKYGSPFILGKADVQQKDTVEFLQAAFAMAAQIGGLVIDRKAEAELVQANASDGSQSHKLFNDYCNCEVSKIVIGQVLSATPKNTGLGSGMAQQAEDIRDDIRVSDTRNLSDTLSRQLFQQILDINGYGYMRAPFVAWGGMRAGAAKIFSNTLVDIKNAGLKLSKPGVQTACENFGFGVEIDPNADKVAAQPFGK